MKIVEVDEIPKVQRINDTPRSSFSEMMRRLNTVMEANIRYGRIIFDNGEYTLLSSALTNLNNAARHMEYPIKFMIRNGELYFERLDMRD